VDAFRNNGGEGKPLFLKVQLSYASTHQEALMGAHDQWRTNILPSEILDDLWLPKQYDAAAKFVRPEDLELSVNISAEPKKHVEWIRAYAELGFDRIILHNVNRAQEFFIQEFGKKVLPFLK
jgi:hypothetical protein